MCNLSKEEPNGSNDNENASSNQDLATEMLEFMNNYAQKLHLSAERDFVLVLGNTGAGKSTLVLTLTGAELTSEPTKAGNFIITDKDGLISGLSATTSRTIIPELMTDKENGITYYDCPGFNDSRGVVNDISVTYLIKQLTEYAKRLKLIFAVSYSSVRIGTGDRRDFIDLAKHAVTFVENLDQYYNGIALVVTKVENSYIRQNNVPCLVEDHQIIEGIAEFLELAKQDLEKKNGENIFKEDQDENSKKIRFIDILLHKNDQNEYDRIEILRLADEEGLIEQITPMQNGKKAIQKMILQNIEFVNTENSKFGYTISHESKNRSHHILEQMQQRLIDDCSNIGDEIVEFYLQQEQYIGDLMQLKDVFSNGHEKFAGIPTTDFKKFIDQTVGVSNELGIGITFDCSNQIWRDIEYTDFIKTMSSNNVSRTFDISKGFLNALQYLKESQDWYTFLIDLHDELSLYRVQKKLPNKNLTDLIHELSNGKHDKINTDDLGIKSLLDDIDFRLTSDLENMSLNSFKANALRKILIQTTSKFLADSPTEDTFVIKGYNVKMSEVMQKCPKKMKYIKVFALNNLFIDTDVDRTGKKSQLSLIAPKWYVIGDRKIILSGKDGEPHGEPKANDGTGYPPKGGENGLPGNPGGASGHFMGIANEVIDGQNLVININGGEGGPGQHGGNGKDGIEGENPPPLGFHLFGSGFGKFRSNSNLGVCRIPPFVTVNYDIEGENGKKPTNGGNGGRGGVGGKGGKDFVAILKSPLQISLNRHDGAGGYDGLGGKGGKGAANGKSVKTKGLFLFVGTLNLEQFEEDGEKIENGENGSDGTNCQQIVFPEYPDPFKDQAKILNSFKNLAREHLASNPIYGTKLREFLNDLDENDQVQSNYDSMDLLDELHGMESQYFKLRHKLSFVPFVKSLLTRIIKLANTPCLSIQNKKILNYLHTATLSKLCSIQYQAKHVSPVDLAKYLKLLQKNIDNLSMIESAKTIKQHRKKFKNILDSKIGVANKLIEKQIKPDIEKIFIEIEHQISKLIEDVMEKRHAEIDEQKLRESLGMQKILYWLKIVGLLVLCIGSIGLIIGLITEAHSSFTPVIVTNHKTNLKSNLGQRNLSSAAPLNDGPSVNSSLKPLIAGFFQSSTEITEMLKKQFQIFNQKLSKIEKTLNQFFECNLMKTIKEAIFQMKSKMSDLEKDDQPNPTEIGTMQKKLCKTIDDEKKALLKSQNNDSEKEAKIQKLELAQNILATNGFSDQVNCAIQRDKLEHSANDQTEELEQKLGKMLFERVREMQQSIIEMSKNLASEGHVQLDISKWQIQSLIRDVKANFHKMTSGFEMGCDLQRSIAKLDEAMTLLVDVYGRIESYAEQSEFAELMANIAESEKNLMNFVDLDDSVDSIDHEQMNTAILHLNGIIKTNLLLEQYEIASNAFKQHKFPFANIYMDMLNLPDNLRFDDIDGLKSEAINKIKKMHEGIQNSDILIEKYDKDVVIKNDLIFYTWKSAEFHHDFVKLLRGEQITLNAEIAKGLNQNAVKFKELEIHFNMINQSAQSELNSKLEDFHVVMTMVGGNSYYRCGKRVYRMSVDENIVIEYSIKKNQHSQPIAKNNVYDKIRNGDFFLSPYTMWSIQLKGEPEKIDGLDKFKNEIVDLQLRGNGQYVENSTDFINDFPSDVLDKHYDFDGVVCYTNDKKLINTL